MFPGMQLTRVVDDILYEKLKRHPSDFDAVPFRDRQRRNAARLRQAAKRELSLLEASP